MVLGEGVSLSADGECWTPNSRPGLMPSPPSLTRSQKQERPAASTAGCMILSHLAQNKRTGWPQCSKYRALHQTSQFEASTLLGCPSMMEPWCDPSLNTPESADKHFLGHLDKMLSTPVLFGIKYTCQISVLFKPAR